MKFRAEIVIVSVGTFLTLLRAGFAADDPFRSCMWVLFFVLTAGAMLLMRGTSFAQPRVGARPSDKYKLAAANQAWND
jgi:cytochrome c oxidase cbb3-type subunit 1